MKQVVKVSIAGGSFTLESDAYQLLESYLDELDAYYKGVTDGSEIISDIEERIAELLIERGGKIGTIQLETVSSIIAVLGHPAEIELHETEESKSSAKEERPVKKLYRDLKDRVVGGVCSGLGAYFSVDAVMIRLIFVLLALVSTIMESFGVRCSIFSNIGGSSFGFMFLLYILLWIIVPAAKTVEQRCAMRGKGAGIDEMHKDVRTHSCSRSNSCQERSRLSIALGGLLGIIGIFIGALFILMGFGGLVSGMILFMGIEIVDGLSLPAMLDYIELGIDNLFLLKLLSLFVWFIPFLLLIYWGVLLCFKFKTPTWRPGLIMFLVWVVAIFALTSLGIKSATPYFDDTKWSDDRPVSSNIDTLYMNLQPFDGIGEAMVLKDRKSGIICADYLLERNKGVLEFVKYPEIRIVKHSPNEDGEPYHGFVECKYTTFSGLSLYRKCEPFTTDSIFTVKDSLLTIYPRIYTKENKFCGEDITLWLHLPAQMCVIKSDERGKITVYDK